MKLPLKKRTGAVKSEVKNIRKEGNIPAILYGATKQPENIVVPGIEFQTGMRNLKLKNERLATTIFELELDGVTMKALVKDIQYHPATYEILHLDFILLSDDKLVTVNVPIHVSGVAECPGIKLGGTLRQVIRSMKVSCLPADIPKEFKIDIRELGLSQSKRLSDIEVPAKVRPMALMNEVALVIAKGKGAA
jgi:large subunit ribosomal protein L25